jgi:ketosteroid isomerase-like protein
VSWQSEARDAIRDLVARYNAQGDAGRFDEMLQLFAADAVLEIGGERHAGSESIRTLFEGAATRTRAEPGSYVRHFTATHQIDLLTREHATGRCYFQVLTPAGLDHWGRYVDVYRSTQGVWQFAQRRIEVEGRVAGGWADEVLGEPSQ